MDVRDWGLCVGGLMCISGASLWHTCDNVGQRRQGHSTDLTLLLSHGLTHVREGDGEKVRPVSVMD